jgi:hypothetical protein
MRTGGLAALLLLTWLVGANAALTSQVLACDSGESVPQAKPKPKAKEKAKT